MVTIFRQINFRWPRRNDKICNIFSNLKTIITLDFIPDWFRSCDRHFVKKIQVVSLSFDISVRKAKIFNETSIF